MANRPIRYLAICADDFGLHEGVDEAICQLIALKRISSFSCMVNASRWLKQSTDLIQTLEATHEVGLHVNFTHFFNNESYLFDLKKLIALSYFKKLSKKSVLESIHQQFDLFEQGLGRLPDFIDGHQHVHQFPIIRETLLSVITQRYRNNPKPWIRQTIPNIYPSNIKTKIIAHLGAYELQRQLQQQGLPHNQQFLGVYSFGQNRFEQDMARWLRQAQNGALLMCHPSRTESIDDEIHAQRIQEYQFLCSESYQQLLIDNNIEIRPLKLTLSA